MTADQSPKQAGEGAGGTNQDCAGGHPAGRYLHTAAVALAIGATVAGRLKAKYAGVSQTPEN